MKISDTYDIMFVFSEIQANEEQNIASKFSKKFIPGKLYSGSSSKDFTKMIKADQYQSMRAQFPDVKVIAQGKKADFKYTEPKKIFQV